MMRIYRIASLELYHASPINNLTYFFPYSHFGSLEQAEGKAGILKAQAEDEGTPVTPTIYKVVATVNNAKRVKDVGDDAWGIEIKKAMAEMHDSIVYENTFEGAGDSYIVFDPNNIKIIDKYVYEGQSW